MNQPDLTPTQFIERARAQAALRRWVLPAIACVLLALIPIVLEGLRPADTSGQLAYQRLEQAQHQANTSESLMKTQAALLVQRNRERQAGQHLTLRPDWSTVIGLIAQQFDAQLMMTGCRLGGADDNAVRSVLGSARGGVPAESVWMIVSGVAAANSDVPGLIVRLESLGLFERIVMTNSQQELVAGGSRTVFTLACRVQ